MLKELKQRILVTLFCLILIGQPFSVGYAGQARVLSDAELDSISAEGFDINVNSVRAFRSAVVAQSNIAAVVARQGDITNAAIHNSNFCKVNNAHNGSGRGRVHSVNYGPSDNSLEVNQLSVDGSAVAAQSNIGVIAALDGNINDSLIENCNVALVKNWGSNAVAAQTNIAVAVAKGGSVDEVTIANTNFADVGNLVAVGTKWHHSVYHSNWGNISIDLTVNQTAAAIQTNIGVIAALNNNVSNSSVTNANIARVYNLH